MGRRAPEGRAHRVTDLLDPVGEAPEPTRSGQLLSKDGVDEGEQQQDVGTWVDREVGVGQVGLSTALSPL